jgi:hypothetical protein
MNEGNGTFPSMVTRKRKKRSRFRYSTKKALEALDCRRGLPRVEFLTSQA